MNGEHKAGDGVFPSLDTETRAAVPTDCAAFHLGRRPQTLRLWASAESGPIRPLRIHGRLAWPVAELRRVLRVGVQG
jgi:hypothetical protein